MLAPVSALVNGVTAPLDTGVALGSTAAAIVAIGLAAPRHAVAAHGVAGVIVLYAASVLVVTPFQPGPEAAGLPLTELDVRQQGQALLSALWGLVGVAVLIAGLVRDDVKVFGFDLASLTSLYRAGSFVALGLLLLAAGFPWQRLRPRPLPDLRTVPGALR